jgi:Sec-independent protein translocase protein TatA
MGIPEVIVLSALVMLIIGGHKIEKLGHGLAEGIQNFKDALGGGPQPPTHPLPGNDSAILNRRRSRSGWET